MVQRFSVSFCRLESVSTVNGCRFHVGFLFACRNGILELGDEKILVDMRDGFLYQLSRVEIHRICILVVDIAPERLKFLLIEVLVQLILENLRFISVVNHVV